MNVISCCRRTLLFAAREACLFDSLVRVRSLGGQCWLPAYPILIFRKMNIGSQSLLRFNKDDDADERHDARGRDVSGFSNSSPFKSENGQRCEHFAEAPVTVVAAFAHYSPLEGSEPVGRGEDLTAAELCPRRARIEQVHVVRD